MHNRRITIIDYSCYGHLVDSIKWCENLQYDHDVTFLTHSPLNDGKVCTRSGNLHIRFARYLKNHFLNNRLFILKCYFYLLFHEGPVMVEYFRHCDLLKKMLPRRQMILDIRTLDVHRSPEVRKKKDQQLRETCQIYDKISVISEGVRDKLDLKDKEVYILPLGSDIISQEKKDYSSLKLLYVGVLEGRDIDKTIEGLGIFHAEHPDIPVSYKIVGGASRQYMEELMKIVRDRDIADLVRFEGFVKHDDLKPYFDKANIGVSFVPMTEYYDAQPATKTFEYSNSGLFVIGTATTENKKCIDSDNGVLIEDTADSFASGLYRIWQGRSAIDESKVRAQLEKYTWKNIIGQYLKPILGCDGSCRADR